MNALAGLRHNFVMPTSQEVAKESCIIHHSLLIYLGFAKNRSGFWHASTKWGLRTKDHVGRYRASDYEDIIFIFGQVQLPLWAKATNN